MNTSKNNPQPAQKQLKPIYLNRKFLDLKKYYITKIQQSNDSDLIRFYLQQFRKLGGK
jgi:hypothetical protein